MINRKVTIRWKGYDPDDLSPKSNRRVWANCDDCGHGRWASKDSYRDLCGSCSLIRRWSDSDVRDEQSKRLLNYYKKHPEVLDEMSRKGIERCDSPEFRNRMSKMMKKYIEDHPEVTEVFIIRMKEFRESHPNAQSEWIKNSNAVKALYEKMRGGNDIIRHHHIYDHDNPKNHIVEITRSQHMSHHLWMRRNGLEVLHINITEENKDIFKLKSVKELEAK